MGRGRFGDLAGRAGASGGSGRGRSAAPEPGGPRTKGGRRECPVNLAVRRRARVGTVIEERLRGHTAACNDEGTSGCRMGGGGGGCWEGVGWAGRRRRRGGGRGVEGRRGPARFVKAAASAEEDRPPVTRTDAVARCVGEVQGVGRVVWCGRWSARGVGGGDGRRSVARGPYDGGAAGRAGGGSRGRRDGVTEDDSRPGRRRSEVRDRRSDGLIIEDARVAGNCGLGSDRAWLILDAGARGGVWSGGDGVGARGWTADDGDVGEPLGSGGREMGHNVGLASRRTAGAPHRRSAFGTFRGVGPTYVTGVVVPVGRARLERGGESGFGGGGGGATSVREIECCCCARARECAIGDEAAREAGRDGAGLSSGS
jgi:hypothetical protein